MKKEKVTQVCAGYEHTLILTQSKKVYSMGSNRIGQLGLGDLYNRNIPLCIESKNFYNEKVIQVRSGAYHSMILTQNGNVYTWGHGTNGQLGHGDKLNKNIPIKIDPSYFNNNPIKYISAGSCFSFALTKSNDLYSWGNIYHNQLGSSNEKIQLKPTFIDPITYNNQTIVKMECGYDHILLLTEKSNGSNHIYSFGGTGCYGQLGVGHNDQRNTFERIDPNCFKNQKIKDIKAGLNFSIALIEEYDSKQTKIYAWGSNFYGKLGLGDEIYRNIPCEINSLSLNHEKIISIGIGAYHSFVITKEQGTKKTKVYAWGPNSKGQLGLGHSDRAKKPTEINMNHFNEQSSYLNRSEQLISVGVNCSAYRHSFAISKTGKLFTWGDNRYGQLGLGHYKDMNEPQLCCPELFGVINTNEKMYMNESFEDVSFEFS